MAFDTSLITKTETWIITQLRTITTVEDREITYFVGTEAWNKSYGENINELVGIALQGGGRAMCSSWRRSIGMPTQEGEQDRYSYYAVQLVIANARAEVAAARLGESATIPGTNLLVEQVINVLHNKYPALSSSILDIATERTEVTNAAALWGPRVASIVEIEMSVREVPKPT